jgi:glyoxylase-like metal-dependent hydrolase (beta-lactamase superfamily II)
MEDIVMLRIIALSTFVACAGALAGASAWAQSAPEVTLARLDCGTGGPRAVNERFSDTQAYGDLKVTFTYSCYLIKHGDAYMLWDTGHSMSAKPDVRPKTSIVDQLAQIKVTPARIKYVGISHYHGDHTGQVDSFPQATVLIGRGDWAAITAPKPAPGVNFKTFTHWISGGGKVEPLAADKDVFGDGTVVVLNTPGHTPGHHALLVKLKEAGNFLLSGDAAHFHENYDSNGVPIFNVSRADTLASLDRMKKIAANLKATVIIQHDARDIGKLPAFPAAAR